MTARAAAFRLLDAPLLDRERLSRARTWGTPVTVAAAVSLLGGFALVAFTLASSRASGRPAADDMARVAFLTAAAQLALALVAVPPLAAPPLATQREEGTFDLLRLGRLTPRHIVVTTLAGAMVPVVLFLVYALPVMAAVFLYAGLDLGQLARAEALTVATACTLGSVATALSAIVARPLGATMAAYGIGLVLYVATGLVGLVVELDAQGGPGALASASHPLVIANPFQAVHALVVAPAAVRAWTASVVVQLGLALLCLAMASQRAGGSDLSTVRVPRRTRR